MAKNLAFDLIGNKISNSDGDTFILLIDHDNASISSLTLMLKQMSYKVTSVNVASEAVSLLEKQMDIVLVIANTEMTHIDSFYASLLTRDIPLILITPDGKKTKPSNSLEKRACYFLEKPISEKDINNMLQHVLSNKSQKLTKSSMPKSGEGNREEHKNQTTLKRQRTSQSSLLGKQLLKKPFIASEAYQESRNVASDELKNKTVYPVESENKRNEGNNIESNIGIGNNFWTYEHQVKKFFSASSNLGYKDSHPKSLLGTMNNPNLTLREPTSPFQTNKAQVDRTDILTKNERTSTYKYPFTLTSIANSYFSAKRSSLAADRVPAATSNIQPCNISPTDTNLVSTSLNSNNFLDHSDLPFGASNSGEMRVTFEDMILSTVQNDYTHCEPSLTSLNSEVTLQNNMTLPQTNINDMGKATPPETNVEDISQVQQDADFPIEDMISFDSDVDKMDMQYVFGNNGSSGMNILSNTQVGDEAYNTPIKEDDGDNEGLDWIDDVFNVDA